MEIHFQDDYFVVINKPSNLLVHHSHYARNIEEESLVELLESEGLKVYPVHRLDRKTSGLLICAKEKEYPSTKSNIFCRNFILIFDSLKIYSTWLSIQKN